MTIPNSDGTPNTGISGMENTDSNAHDKGMDDDLHRTQGQPPRAWLEALAEGEADLKAGRTVPWDEARARFVAMLSEMEAEPARDPA
jgi:hypothetical protein